MKRRTQLFACAGFMFGAFAVALGNGSPGNRHSTVIFSNPGAQVPALKGWRPNAALIFRGAHPSYAWRRFGKVKHMIQFPTPIQHIVVVQMENRTVDNLFAAYYGQPFPNPLYPSWDQALDLYNPNAPYPQHTLEPMSLAANVGPNHSHGGLSNKGGFENEVESDFTVESFGCHNMNCSPAPTAFAAVPTAETAPYAFLIENWAFADNVLQSNEGPSFPNHQYMIAGQTGGAPGALSSPFAEAENPTCPTCTPMPTTQIYEEDNPQRDMEDSSGCYPSRSVVNTLNMASPYPQPERNNPLIYPCEEYSTNDAGTILDEAVTMGTPPYLDWQYIAPSIGSFWAAPMGVTHLYQAYVNASDKSTQPFAIDGDAINFVNSLNNKGNPQRPFAAITYISPCFSESDHPDSLSTTGPLWLGWLINSIATAQNGTYWPNTAILVTWDDWGGWFDHVPPVPPPVHPYPNTYGNPSDPNEWGIRVPLMMISPYVYSRAYVSQPTSPYGVPIRSQSTIIQYIEATFNLPTLGTDDYYQNLDSQHRPRDFLNDMVYYRQSPLKYIPVPVGTYSPKPCS